MGDSTTLKVIFACAIIVSVILVKAEYDVFNYPRFIEGEVISISYISGPWENTLVYFRTYSETSIIRVFSGKVELKHGDICRVHYRRPMFRFYNTILEIEMLEG